MTGPQHPSAAEPEGVNRHTAQTEGTRRNTGHTCACSGAVAGGCRGGRQTCTRKMQQAKNKANGHSTNTRKPHSRANACGTAVKKTGSHNVEKQLPKDRHRHTGERNGAAVGGRERAGRQGGGEN